jgi:tetratricopeptide (TPR) repeat protein
LVQRYLGAAYLQQADQLAAAGDTPGAMAAVRRALPLLRGEPWLRDRLLAAYQVWGKNSFDAGLIASITRPLEQAVVAPDAAAADYLTLAQTLQKLGNNSAALDLYHQTLARWPQDATALAALSSPNVVNLDARLAAAVYEQRIRNNPTDGDAYAELSELYLAQRRFDYAVALYQAAAAANPQAAWPQLALGQLYARQGVQQP